MKKIILLFSFSLSLFSYQTYTDKLDRIVKDVEKEQISLDRVKLSKTKDPFVTKNDQKKLLKSKNKTSVIKSKTKSSRRYTKKLSFGVEGVFDDSVLVRGKWYKQGQYIGKRFLVKKVYEDRVELKSKYSKKIYKVKIGELNEKIKINIF
ncbi:MAG: Unknown protein [uncultured Campylobacterales bacterium]|uniref:Uncharacterized protein n=1 Tax=uncultured Campylobacterales bacterium TaxID=352960 RepID=A0A6S6SNJ2_9BACT|nr:MAG: Unknown protein [uncultured Campylobacterales bacterium]